MHNHHRISWEKSLKHCSLTTPLTSHTSWIPCAILLGILIARQLDTRTSLVYVFHFPATNA